MSRLQEAGAQEGPVEVDRELRVGQGHRAPLLKILNHRLHRTLLQGTFLKYHRLHRKTRHLPMSHKGLSCNQQTTLLTGILLPIKGPLLLYHSKLQLRLKYQPLI